QTFNPAPVAVLDLPAGYPNNVEVAGDFAYVADGDAGLAVVDVLNRQAPALAALLSLPGSANDVRIAGNLAYVADGSGGLRIVDVTNPRVPVARGAVAPAGVDFRDVVIHAGLAYVADRNGKLWRIDVSNPGTPAVVDFIPLVDSLGAPLEPSGVALADDGSWAVVAVGRSSGAPSD